MTIYIFFVIGQEVMATTYYHLGTWTRQLHDSTWQDKFSSWYTLLKRFLWGTCDGRQVLCLPCYIFQSIWFSGLPCLTQCCSSPSWRPFGGGGALPSKLHWLRMNKLASLRVETTTGLNEPPYKKISRMIRQAQFSVQYDHIHPTKFQNRAMRRF